MKEPTVLLEHHLALLRQCGLESSFDSPPGITQDRHDRLLNDICRYAFWQDKCIPVLPVIQKYFHDRPR